MNGTFYVEPHEIEDCFKMIGLMEKFRIIETDKTVSIESSWEDEYGNECEERVYIITID